MVAVLFMLMILVFFLNCQITNLAIIEDLLCYQMLPIEKSAKKLIKKQKRDKYVN